MVERYCKILNIIIGIQFIDVVSLHFLLTFVEHNFYMPVV